jgi:hypothetical protein
LLLTHPTARVSEIQGVGPRDLPPSAWKLAWILATSRELLPAAMSIVPIQSKPQACFARTLCGGMMIKEEKQSIVIES